MTPRKRESREAFQKRRADYDAHRFERHRLPQTDQNEALARIRQLEREIDTLKDQIAERDARDREELLRSSMRFDPLVIPSETHKAGAPGMPMVEWSDWHCGETVDLRETGGLNEFNQKIFRARVESLVNNIIYLLRDYSGTNPEFPGIWVLLGGDMVSGLIHEELVETNWGNIVDQAMEVGGAIIGALRRLAEEFKKVFVVGVVGNHGRTTKKPTAKGRALDSYDRAVYKSIQRHFADDPRFHITIPDDTDFLFKVYGHRFLLTHGDSLGVKGGDGIIGALGPIARGAVKLRNSESQIGRDFDTIVMGHWHQYIPRGDALGVIVNGALKGYDEYARIVLRARFARPSQALWLVSPRHGIAAQWAVYL